jgi:integrase
MARSVKDAVLDSRTARSRLKARRKPYYRQLEPGVHLGFRKPQTGSGKWLDRWSTGDGGYATETFATADDFSDADGIAILNFGQAVAAVRERMVKRAHRAADGVKKASPTVATCVDDYVEYLEANKKSGREARYAADADILPALGKIKVDALTTEQIRKWHHGLAKAGARIRTKKGEPQRYRDNEADPEWQRRRKSTANRVLTILKAALNRTWRDGQVASDTAWRRVEPFENVESSRVRYLAIAEARRFINAADPDFRKLVRGALESGARYGELCALTVADFNPDSGTVAVVQSKWKSRHIVLTNDGVEFFKSLTAGRIGTEPMFLKDDGSRWLPDHQAEPIADANKRAKISPPINFHGLRHTWASHAVMGGMPLMLVAKNLGHTTTRMVEKHYGHLSPSFVADTIRATAPRFGVRATGNVKPLRS